MLPYVVGLICLIVGAAIGYFVERTMRGGAYKTRDEIVQQAQREAENIAKSA